VGACFFKGLVVLLGREEFLSIMPAAFIRIKVLKCIARRLVLGTFKWTGQHTWHICSAITDWESGGAPKIYRLARGVIAKRWGIAKRESDVVFVEGKIILAGFVCVESALHQPLAINCTLGAKISEAGGERWISSGKPFSQSTSSTSPESILGPWQLYVTLLILSPRMDDHLLETVPQGLQLRRTEPQESHFEPQLGKCHGFALPKTPLLISRYIGAGE